MPLSMAAKAALCICPPAVMAGTVATVPAAKKAVHHITAPKAKPRAIKSASLDTPAAPAGATQQPVDCDSNAAVAIPAVPLVTYAAPVPDEPSGGSGPGFVPTGASVGAIGVVGGGGGGTTPGNPGGDGGVVPGPIPEPSVWLMMISGIGTLGALMRRRRRAALASRRGSRQTGARHAAAGLGLWSGSAAVEAGDVAATVAVKSAVASAAGKALLCVCPAAVIAGSVVAVPPLRQAVHAATKIPDSTPYVPVATMGSGIACVDPAIVPVSGESLAGFPASVKTAVSELTGTPVSPMPSASAPVTPIGDRAGWMASASTTAANPLS